METARLERLIVVLEGVREAEKLFDINVWIDSDNAAACGTSACAAGYAALDPQLQRQGFHLVANKLDGFTATVRTTQDFNKIVDDLIGITIAYRGAVGYTAAENFFGINSASARSISNGQATRRYSGTIRRPSSVLTIAYSLIAKGMNGWRMS